MQTLKVLDIEIEFERENISNKISNLIQNRTKGYVNTINANLLVTAYKKQDYKEILQKSSFNICDGSVLVSALNKINKTNYNSYPGPDFFIDRISEKKYKHTFLGSTKEVLRNLKEELIKIDSSIEKAIFIEVPFINVNEFDYCAIGNTINDTSSDFIWVSLGAPKQEEFSSLLVKHINHGLIVSVGAAFDFYSNLSKVKRAPIYIQTLRLEWLYRLYKQPIKTFKRLKNEFFYMPIILIKELMKAK